MSIFDDRCKSGEDSQKDVADETFAGDALEPTLEQENGGTNPPDIKDDQLDLGVVEKIVYIQDNIELELEELKYD